MTILGVDTDGEAVLGRSTTTLARQSLLPGVTSSRSFPITVNQSLTMMVELRADEEGFELRLYDAFRTPLLEWRFEATDRPELGPQQARAIPHALALLERWPLDDA